MSDDEQLERQRGATADEGSERDDAELEDFAVSSGDEAGDAPGLDKAMMDELLLVCSNLGMLRVEQEGEAPVLMRGEDCAAWVHDLQRAVRRDHAKHKLVAKQLGKWCILQKKLLPLVVNHQHDWELVFSILKVLVMLTMRPTKDSTNIAEQLKYLRQYKHEFLRQGVIPILMNLLVEPLTHRGTARTEQDYLVMELVLTLIRNLLGIPNLDPRFATSSTIYLSHLQQSLICTLEDESVYEMILLFTQDIESPENREWNLLIMEIIDLSISGTTPKELAAFAKQKLKGTEPVAHAAPSVLASARTPPSSVRGRSPRVTAPTESGSLLDQLKQESASKNRLGASRHSNFGGVVTMKGPTGRETVITQLSQVSEGAVPQAPKKPMSRRRGKQQAQQAPDINEVFGSKEIISSRDEATMSVLTNLCDTLISKSYFQLTNSLKTEFRRGSTKLVLSDRLQYFHLVWFLTSYHKLKIQALKSHYKQQMKAYEKKKQELLAAMDFDSPQPEEPSKPDYEEKAVLSTLDMFSFNFVLQSVENYAGIKNYHGMTVSVQLLTEMMGYITEMAASDDPRFQRIADSLQHKIFYERDFLDRLPVLLKTWTPGNFSRAYVTDVVTLTHLVFKVLDSQGSIKVLSRRKALLERKQPKKPKEGGNDDGESTDEEESERQAQLLLEMQRKEADFDVRRYFSSIVSSDTIKMYLYLLSHYRENSPKVNHYIHSFFYRVKHFQIQQNEEWTMQPLLFNIHALMLFNVMLQDASIQRDQAYVGFLDFIRGIVRDYFTLADKNHLLFVESLLRQTYASRSCLLIQRCYDPLDSMSKSRAEAVALGREKKIAMINEIRRQKIAMDHEELEGETEFTFSLNPSDFQSSSLVSSAEARGGDGEDGNTGDANSGASEATKPKKRASHKAAVERAKNWTRVEDRHLAKMFMKFRHLPSVYEVISYEDMFQDRDRTPEQIERRVKYLKLHRKTHDSSDEEEDKEASEGENSDIPIDSIGSGIDPVPTPSRPRRRLRRAAEFDDGSGSDSDDDLLIGGSGARPEPSFEPAETTTESMGGTNGEEEGETEEMDIGGEETQVIDESQPETQIIDEGAADVEIASSDETAPMNETDLFEPTSATTTGDDTDISSLDNSLKRGRDDEEGGGVEDSPSKKLARVESDKEATAPTEGEQTSLEPLDDA